MPYRKIQKTIIISLILFFTGFVFCSAGYAENEIEFIPGEDSGFFYIIKKGDTLWDLSEKFYNSEWDWPALWQMNDEIKNPHWIYPGRKIRIFFREYGKMKPKIVTVTKVKKEIKPIKPKFSFSQMNRIGFIRATKELSLGSIIKDKVGKIGMATRDIIFIKTNKNGELLPGKTYHIFSTKKVEEKIHDKKFQGIQHLIKAEAKVLENKGEYAKAVITRSFDAVHSEDMVMSFMDREKILEVEEKPPAIDARIIGNEIWSTLVNNFRIAFINVGSETVKPGEMYTVYRKNEAKDYSLYKPEAKKLKIKLEDMESCKLIVLHTEDIASTVILLSSIHEVLTDDIVK